MEDPVVLLERSLYGHPLAGLSWKRPFEKVYIGTRLGKSSKLGVLNFHWQKDHSHLCVWTERNWQARNTDISPTSKILMKDVDLEEPTPCLDHVSLGCTQRECQISKDIVDKYRSEFESRISAGAMDKLPETKATEKPDAEPISSWSYDMEGHAKKCVERYCELANKTTQQLYKVAHAMH